MRRNKSARRVKQMIMIQLSRRTKLVNQGQSAIKALTQSDRDRIV